MPSQHERNQLARAARESGLCMKCGGEIEDKETLSREGLPYANCVRCRPSKKARVNERDVQNPRPRVAQDADYCFFDTVDFKAICKFIRNSLPSTETFTTGDIKRAAIEKGMSEETVKRHIDDVIWWLEDKDIVCIRDISPKRYTRLKTPRAKPPTGYQNWSIVPRTEKLPDFDSIYREARV